MDGRRQQCQAGGALCRGFGRLLLSQLVSSASTQKQKSSLAEIQIRRIFQDYLNSFALCVILQQNRQISMSPPKGQGIVILLSNKHRFGTC